MAIAAFDRAHQWPRRFTQMYWPVLSFGQYIWNRRGHWWARSKAAMAIKRTTGVFFAITRFLSPSNGFQFLQYCKTTDDLWVRKALHFSWYGPHSETRPEYLAHGILWHFSPLSDGFVSPGLLVRCGWTPSPRQDCLGDAVSVLAPRTNCWMPLRAVKSTRSKVGQINCLGRMITGFFKLQKFSVCFFHEAEVWERNGSNRWETQQKQQKRQFFYWIDCQKCWISLGMNYIQDCALLV